MFYVQTCQMPDRFNQFYLLFLCQVITEILEDSQFLFFMQVGDPYLDIKRACLCVETVLEHFGGRHLTLSQSWETLESSITVEREFRILWDKAMADSSKVCLK